MNLNPQLTSRNPPLYCNEPAILCLLNRALYPFNYGIFNIHRYESAQIENSIEGKRTENMNFGVE